MLEQDGCDAVNAQSTHKSAVEKVLNWFLILSQVSPLLTLYHFWPVSKRLGS